MHIGIDLGGTKIELRAFEKNSGDELYKKRIPTPKTTYSDTLNAMAGLVIEAEEALNKTGTVGIGIPGAISKDTGLVKNANSTKLIGHPLDKDIGKLLSRPIRVSNDANCFVLSEAVDGAAKEGKVVFGVILGTGCGGGIVVNKHIIEGANLIAGEWGHNPLPQQTEYEYRNAPECYCGKKGCIETWVSGTGFHQDYTRQTGIESSGKKIMELVAKQDGKAINALDNYMDRLARSLASIMNILDPDIIVLGGGMSNVDLLYERVPLLWKPHVFSDFIHTKLVPPQYGDSSGVRGAAWLWKE